MGSFNRDGVKRRIIEVLDAVLTPLDVKVSYEWPGDDFADSYVYLDAPVRGPNDRTSTGAQPGTRAHKTDTFTIDGILATYPGTLSAKDAEQACGDLLRLVDDSLRKLTRLKDTAGVVGVDDGYEPATYEGVRSVVISDVDGPAVFKAQAEDDPIGAGVLFTLTCISDL